MNQWEMPVKHIKEDVTIFSELDSHGQKIFIVGAVVFIVLIALLFVGVVTVTK